MAYEEAMGYGAKVVLGDRPVHVSYLTSLFYMFHLWKCLVLFFWIHDSHENSRIFIWNV